MKHLTALATIALTCLGIASPANAFIFLKSSTYDKGERPVSSAPIWTGRVLRFYVNTNIGVEGGSSPTTVTGSELYQAVEQMVAAWNAACRADFRVEVAGTTSSVYNSSDGVNVIHWDNRTQAEGNYYGADTATILASATTLTSANEFKDCDIVVNGAAATPLAYNPGGTDADLRSVLAHEIGHCLGLDHTIEPPSYDSTNPYLTQATMVQTSTLGSPNDTTRRDINQDDRDGVECIYERGRPIRTGVRCSSYHGTNGQGSIVGQTAISGGPTADDTVCGSDAQGRNARPSEESGDGCIPSAIASTSETDISSRVGSSWGFLVLIFSIFLIRRFVRRSLRRASVFFLVASALSVSNAKAWNLELSFAGKKANPKDWKTFSSMDPTVTTWDRSPAPVDFSGLTEISATAFHDAKNWGRWGWFATFTMPKTLSTNAKAQGAAEQSKETSLWGFRLGPTVRWFPIEPKRIRWFVGGRFGIGILSGSQTFTSSSSGSVSYRAYSTEFALSSGAEVPLGGVTLVGEFGYSRLHSSYFTSTDNSGSLYSDFPSGTRLAVSTGAGSEDLKFRADGIYAAIGVQIPLGKTAKKAEERFDDYEGSPTPEPTSTPTPVAEPTPEPSPTATPEPTPSSTPAPIPTPTPSIEVLPTPAPTPMPTPTSSPRKRESWEIDAPPEIPSEESSGVIEAPRPDQPDPVPGL